ncbi:MAG: sigma-70 family RNA polymerase sigma factor [Clostridia bacterium]|nr:sigma-70 family RNA polymerase sigma factor [Clostridia bacterium]
MSKNLVTDLIANEWSKLKSYLTYQYKMLSEQDAEDIIQETAYRMLKSSRKFDEVEYLSAYVYQSIRNTAVSYFRTRKETAPLHEFILPSAINVEDEVISKEIAKEVKQAINELDQKSKTVWIATEMLGKSFKDLSEELNEPIGTLLSRKKRANDKVKEKILTKMEKENK